MLFRKLRVLFAKGAEVYSSLRGVSAPTVNALIDRAEDVYDPRTMNLDGFLAALREAVGEHPSVELVAQTIHYFRVHFVLNMFSGVQDSYETAVRPFVTNLLSKVSGRLSIMNLGWIVAHDDINRANGRRVPVLLGKTASRNDPSRELARLARRYLGSRSTSAKAIAQPDPTQYLNVQLETLRRMNDDLKGAGYRENFKYVVYRALHLMASLRVSDFGDSRLFKPSEMAAALARRQRV
jgi:hypothetical protein